jgi:hypothetical protein
VLVGHVLPALLVVAALAGMPGRAALSVAAGLLVVAGGWVLKFTLVRRAAFTQGLALRHLPVRGAGSGRSRHQTGLEDNRRDESGITQFREANTRWDQ